MPSREVEWLEGFLTLSVQLQFRITMAVVATSEYGDMTVKSING